eukprot:CAMPEP_0119086634 /NCGR_PEP_ID=MMETSP1178-20130426/138827_1 /TAXON_ID=33656 /ORGANISM="unid sp, Strain CCMP2000" /LENGTH=82 /DNA_ID=CAMNT_0007069787 /DNA_START=43 /DNA_END=289 /DNA_ORIENTATION=-
MYPKLELGGNSTTTPHQRSQADSAGARAGKPTLASLAPALSAPASRPPNRPPAAAAIVSHPSHIGSTSAGGVGSVGGGGGVG